MTVTVIPSAPADPKWERQDGLRTIPITLGEILEAVEAGRSLIMKELAFNPVIKDDPRMHAAYDKHHVILGKLMEKLGHGSSRVRQEPRRIIPSRAFHK